MHVLWDSGSQSEALGLSSVNAMSRQFLIVEEGKEV